MPTFICMAGFALMVQLDCRRQQIREMRGSAVHRDLNRSPLSLWEIPVEDLDSGFCNAQLDLQRSVCSNTDPQQIPASLRYQYFAPSVEVLQQNYNNVSVMLQQTGHEVYTCRSFMRCD